MNGATDCSSDYLVSSYLPTIASMHAPRQSYDSHVLQIVQPLLPEMAQLSSTVSVQTSAVRATVPEGALLYSGSLHFVPDGRSVALDGRHGVLEPRAANASFLHLGSPSRQPDQYTDDSLDGTVRPALSASTTAHLTLYDSVEEDDGPINEFNNLGVEMMAAGYRSVVATMW